MEKSKLIKLMTSTAAIGAVGAGAAISVSSCSNASKGDKSINAEFHGQLIQNVATTNAAIIVHGFNGVDLLKMNDIVSPVQGLTFTKGVPVDNELIYTITGTPST
jgi:hypothetical protein